MSNLDKIFVKRYNVGIKGTSKFNELVPAKNKTEARRRYASCIKDKTMINKISTMYKNNHTIGCDLESYAQTLRFRGYESIADDLDRIASRIK